MINGMLQAACEWLGLAGGAAPQEPTAQQQMVVLPKCAHEEWWVLGSNRIGYGTCKTCHASVCLDDLFNRLHDRMEAATRAANEAAHQARSAADPASRVK